ncbi:MAG: gliding motility protein GldM [Bacteroidetes bacterium]|nr:gliding motility protein GldM [Bacteroidota bacterium]
MAGYKETPRQKMIGMMYLVLTALLALNVSKQMLDAFIVVNETMENTNSNFNKKLDNTLSKFKVQYQMNPNKVGPYWDRAKKARQLSENLANFIDSLKYTVVSQTERIPYKDAKVLSLANCDKKENYDQPTNFFIGNSQDGSAGEARVLKNRIEAYKKEMTALLDAKYQGTMKLGLKTEGQFKDSYNEAQNWEMHNFYHTILAATVTILNQIKADVYNAEFDVVNNLFAAVSAEDWKFDAIRAKVIPKSNYVFLGEEYSAEILVAAYDTKANPNVRYMLGSDTLTPANFKNATPITGENGVVTLKLGGSSEGLKKFAGIIKIVSPLGDTMTFHFKDEFIVAKPALTISPTKMNVFYIGVDNPVSITVPGGPERVTPTISVGNIRPEGKDYIVSGLPQNTREAVISVTAVFSGKSKNMGSYTARLKRVPDPIAKIGGKNEGVISKSIVLASPFLVPEMPTGFDFDLKYVVTSYNFVTDITGDIYEVKVQGNRLSPEIVRMITNARKNKRLWFENITVKGPDGERTIASINLKIN